MYTIKRYSNKIILDADKLTRLTWIMHIPIIHKHKMNLCNNLHLAAREIAGSKHLIRKYIWFTYFTMSRSLLVLTC